MGLGKMFSDPNIFGKLAANPRTSKHLADPSFVQKVCISPELFKRIIITRFQIQLIQQNPRLANKYVCPLRTIVICL